MVETHILGFPRIGPKRELKLALESFWREESDEVALRKTAAALRVQSWRLQRDSGLSWVTVGDFSLYDHVLDTACMLGTLPPRFVANPQARGIEGYFAMARGNAAQPALELTKWLDTNYHYLVPELDHGSCLEADASPLLGAVREAQALGHRVKPVLLGPLTFLKLGKSARPGQDPLTLLPQVVAAFGAILRELEAFGVAWVQVDEPMLAGEVDATWRAAFETAYNSLPAERPRLLLTTYFDSVAEHASWLPSLPLDGIHLDLVRGADQLKPWLGALPSSWVLSAGVVDGRNIWANDLSASLDRLEGARKALGDRLWIGSSCSLLHVPFDLATERALEPRQRCRLAFAVQKLSEVHAIGAGLARGRHAIATTLAISDAVAKDRFSPAHVADESVRGRAAAIGDAMTKRRSRFEQRVARQRGWLKLPLLPTTTIGSFPQTGEIRAARAALKRGQLSAATYDETIRTEVTQTIERQERLGLDVLVHGEAERNDMVQYFAERLEGFAITEHGWVQSYGSRCVKPPIIQDDVVRRRPITVDVARHAQSLTRKIVKGMLTGPVTMLQWSFVRDDQPRAETALQIALALRDEVLDLEAAGIRIIQIDEPAFREGLPLKKEAWAGYLDWASRAFRVAASGVRDETQIHTHMCYSEFQDIIAAIESLDADVITIETSRSRMDLLDAFVSRAYPNEIGPGVYDIHSPRTPAIEDMVALIERAAAVIPIERLWINPDCGLKTRAWPEVEAALAGMVEAAAIVRARQSMPRLQVATERRS